MNLVLKIAVGVFAGILAAFGVYTLIETYEMHERERALVEQQRVESIARNEFLKDTLLRTSLEKVVLRCGPPIAERNEHPYWALMYRGTDEETVWLQFGCTTEKKGCNFFAMERGTQETGPRGMESSFGVVGDDKSDIAIAGELPCLIPSPK